MLKRKISNLISHRSLRAQKIFLKFCYFSLIIGIISCKSDAKSTIEKEGNTSKTEEKVEKDSPKKRIVIFGDSLTAGYGLDDVNDAFPGVLQEKIDELNLPYKVVNSGVSGETTAGGKNRIDWILTQKPDIFILELGANDGLRGVPLTATKTNLQTIIDRVKSKYPKTQIILAGMQIPPNLGQDYTNTFKNIFPDLAKENNLKLIPFLLKNVGGVASLNQTDGIHPTAEGHQLLANNVWEVLQPLLK